MVKKWTLTAKKDRPSKVLATHRGKVVSTYTLDRTYVHTYELTGDYWQTRKVQPLGSIVALDPTTQKVVPNYTAYNFGPLGVILHDVDATEADQEVGVLVKGYAIEDRCWDNGDYGSITAATKQALYPRIIFVKVGGQGLKTIK